MYYPYLRGKQFELLAIREYVSTHLNSTDIVPIIEPVNKAVASLQTCIKTLVSSSFKFALVLNSKEGELKHATLNLLEQIPSLNDVREYWIPAFVCKKISDVPSILSKYGDMNGIMIIFKDGLDTNDANIGILSDSRIEYIVAGNYSSASIADLVEIPDKKIICLDDKFNERPRNADYLEVQNELFTDRPFFYKREGLHGFSDYTTLPKIFQDGGRLPWAVAIHITYQHSKREIYVGHFVSDTNDSNRDIANKFFEACSKIDAFFNNRQDSTAAVRELISMVKPGTQKYPGLGVIKKLSIENHLELIHNLGI